MTVRVPRDGEMVCWAVGQEPLIDECTCGQRKVSHTHLRLGEASTPPDGGHNFDGTPCDKPCPYCGCPSVSEHESDGAWCGVHEFWCTEDDAAERAKARLT